MDHRQTLLIAKYSARYSVRGGIGLVFLLLSLTFGLLVAHLMLQPVEMPVKAIMARSADADRAETTRLVLEELIKRAKPVVSWMVSTKTDAPGQRDAAADLWSDYLLDDRPGMLSAIFLILLFGWPLVVSFGAFDLYASDINSRQLRYQLLRTDRGSIYFGRLLGMVATFVAVLLFLGFTVTVYMGLKLPLYPWTHLIGWAAYGTCALVIVSLPYIGLCAWISASIGSAFSALTVTSLVIGGVPLLAMFGSMSWAPAKYLNWALPWGFQMRLFHHDPVQVALATAGCGVLTLLFTWLGHRKFTRRDL